MAAEPGRAPKKKERLLVRILMLAHEAYGGRGGIAKFNRDLIVSLCSFPKVEKVVAIARFAVDQPGQLPDKLTYPTSGLGGKLPFFATVLRTVLREPQFDLVIAGHLNLLALARLSRGRSAAPLVLTMHGIEAWQPSHSSFVNRSIDAIDRCISVSAFTKERFLTWAKLDPSRFVILPNCVDPAGFAPGPKNQALIKRYGLEGKTVLLTLGRMDAREQSKGIDEVLSVLPALLNAVPGLVYLIVGEGTDRSRLEDKAVALGLGNQVVFAGYIDEAEKPDLYRLADAFVMPSRTEGFGIVYLEALASGVPALGSKLDGSREALRDGQLGVVVDPSDSDELRRGILDVLSRPKGVVAEGLKDFYFPRFEARVHAALEQIVTTGRH